MKQRLLIKGLAVSVIILFIGVGVQPAIAINNTTKPISNSNTLYVGGTGPGNYTKIQDAIDNASDGDTVFVYDDSSPYYECIWINRSIDLIGENRATTIIDGNGGNYAVAFFDTDWVNISGFTIQNSGYWGILLEWCNFNTISGNNILNNVYGLFLHHSHCNTITGNYIISNSGYGISIYQLCNKTIIPDNNNTLHIYPSYENIIYNNYFNNTRNAEDDWYNIWNINKTLDINIIGGQWLGGNYWSDYTGDDLDGDGLGDTKLPYNNGLKEGGDWLPLTNQPPGITIINGTTSGKPGHIYSYTLIAVDPNGDDLLYYIDWGDNISEWTDFNSSGTDVIVKHKWGEEGTYKITAKAKDIYGAKGPEGTLTIAIPRTRISYLWFLERFPLLERLL